MIGRETTNKQRYSNGMTDKHRDRYLRTDRQKIRHTDIYWRMIQQTDLQILEDGDKQTDTQILKDRHRQTIGYISFSRIRHTNEAAWNLSELMITADLCVCHGC